MVFVSKGIMQLYYYDKTDFEITVHQNVLGSLIAKQNDGLCFGSGEAAFQAQKCIDRTDRLMFRDMRPSEAKRAGRRVLLRPDWEHIKVELMEEIVRAKFTQNADLAHMLLSTVDRLLREGNTWHDTCWGVDYVTGEGENHLGKILMKIREELRCTNKDKVFDKTSQKSPVDGWKALCYSIFVIDCLCVLR